MSDKKKTEGITAVKGTIIIPAKGPADRNPNAKILNKVLQMNGETVARELPAEHQLITDGWDRYSYFPSLVYMLEKDRLLLLYISRDSSQSLANSHLVMISSDDHGKTWINPTKNIKDARGIPYQLTGGSGLAYFGNGELTMDVSDENSDALRLFSHDYGETWVSMPIPKSSGGFTWDIWDPCLADKDPVTGELKRLIDTGCSKEMEKQFDQAKRIVVFPNEWHWRHDPEDEGLTEEWHQEGSFDNWPRMIRIDKRLTMQGESLGVGWYATSFEMPDTNNAPLLILFGAVDGYCDVFIDGKKVGEHKKPPEIMRNCPFHLPLDKGLSPGRHTMVIRVAKDSANAGIYRPVWIVEKPGSDTARHKTLFRGYSSGIRFSYDGGLTYPEEIKPASWNGGTDGLVVSEVALGRIGNKDLVAACRTRHYEKFPLETCSIDHYSGLGISLSRDNGYTWTKIKVLYEYGRMHPCMALMPNGDIVMTYVVRMGLLNEEHSVLDEDGYPQWSVEAVVSRDNGENWDLAHKYILAKWSGMSQAQATTTVLLPDGSLLTAFGSGYLSQPVKEDKRKGEANLLCTHEVCLVRWRPEE